MITTECVPCAAEVSGVLTVTVLAYIVTCVPFAQKAMAPESCMVLLNEHPQLKYATTRSVAKHSVGKSNVQLFKLFSAVHCLNAGLLCKEWQIFKDCLCCQSLPR